MSSTANSDLRCPGEPAGLFALAPIGLLMVDAAGVILSLNDAAVRVLGVDRSSLIGLPLPEQLDPADRERLGRLLGAALSEPAPGLEPLELVWRRGGRARHLRLRGSRIPPAAGAVPTALLALEETSDGARARELLGNAAEFLAAFEAVRDAGGQVVDWRCVHANRDVRVGPGRESLVGRTMREAMPQRAASVHARLLQVLETGAGDQYDTTFEDRRFLVRLFRVDGETVGSAATDVTERRRTEEALRENKDVARSRAAELEAVLATVPAAVWIARDPRCERIDGNPYGLELLRLAPGGNVSLTAPREEGSPGFRALQDGREVQGDDLAMQVAARTGREVRAVEQTIQFEDGAVVHMFGNAVPLLDPDGRPTGAVGAFVDISERKRAEAELREAQRRLAADLDAMTRLHRLATQFVRAPLATLLQEAVETAIALTGADMGNVQLLDPATGRLHIAAHRGHERWWLEYFAAAREAKGACGVALEQRARVVVEDVAASPVFVGTPVLEVQLRAGIRAVQSTPLVDSTGAPVGVISTHFRRPHRPDEQALRFLDLLARQTAEMVERGRAQEALRSSEERLRLALSAASMIAWEYHPESGRVTLSENAPDVPSLPSGRVHEHGDRGYAVVHPEDVEAHRARVNAAIEGAGSYVSVYRQVGDGGTVWLEERGMAVADASGRTVRLVGVTQNITERKLAQDEVRLAKERLEESDRRKNEFLALLSHELRNPLAPIKNALFVLDHAHPEGQQARRAKDIASRQVAHLARLVDDLLDVTRISRGRIELRREDLDLAALARRIAEDYRRLLQDRGLELAVEVPPEPVLVNGDPARLTQVLGNLLNNAAKFTPAGGLVTLSLRPEGDRVRVRVRDTGLGIAADTLPTIFDPFIQGKQTLARSEGGLGLGLALVKDLVALHGGQVTVSSREGAGSEFAISLARVAPPAGAHAGEHGPGSPAGAEPRRRVLVVDDNPDAAETLGDLLRMLGHEVDIAHDGPSAVAHVNRRPPEIVLCDIGLPGMDGYAVARAIRASQRGGAVRLVAVSGYAQTEDLRRAREAGFDAHVAKPPEPEALRRLLEPTPAAPARVGPDGP